MFIPAQRVSTQRRADAPQRTDMTSYAVSQIRDRHFAGHRAGAISLLFAIMIIPLLLIVGIAIDFSFYAQAQAELNLAADAAAMHAVRAMSMATSNNTTYQNAGTLAGQQWFAAQAEVVPGVTLTGTGTPLPVSVTVSYNPPTYTATVTYTGTMNTVFGRLVGIKTWPIAGTATSTISNNFVDIGIMIDNSQSMLIGATQADITSLNNMTPCAIVKTENGVTPGLGMGAYSYYLNGPTSIYGTNGPYPGNGGGSPYGYLAGLGQVLPPYTGAGKDSVPASRAYCDPGYNSGSPGLAACAYPPSFIYGANDTQYYQSGTTTNADGTKNLPGSCSNGGGANGSVGEHTPQAPCSFACHQNSDGGDYYALARSNNINLRLDVVQSAAQQVVQSMITYSPAPQSLLGVGIYTFNTTLQPVYPCTSLIACASPFGTNLSTAYSDLAICSGTQTTGCLLPPVTNDQPNTDINTVFSEAALFFKGTAGDGSTQAKAIKNLFLITDGISDWSYLGNQVVGPIDSLVANPCAQIKNQGITLYVLYTPYYPIPTWTYTQVQNPQTLAYTYPAGVILSQFVTEANPTNFPNYNANYPTDTPVQAALRACASNPAYFYTATNQADINAAMQSMLASALNSAARVTN
jgi:Flp pilus assembly protein TadG